ncbi:hypothetical protein PR048_029205 [Dryococelus australis]|uniref:Uncharacterized protein n=1 Tax=Dryococelus australis TaxID=614101 RepID=A0ABQ9GCQ0_9NEOP|nr:hypothetical protein PR048_029205 [Dryococelus australis]
MASHMPTTRVNALRLWTYTTDWARRCCPDGRSPTIHQLTSMQHCERIMRLTAGTSQIRTSTGESINVDIDLKTVRVINLPVEIKNENILHALQHYGEI